jgi:uncharacterized protein YlxW (UPF0749 family)
MEALVVSIQILLLVGGWVLFQQAKSDLTARAAQMPVLTEVKALQKSIAALLEQLRRESAQISTQLEARFVEARELLAALDKRLEEIKQLSARAAVRRRGARDPSPSASTSRVSEIPSMENSPSQIIPPRHQEVYALADDGLTPAVIAQRTGFAEGEVELILELRQKSTE